MQNTAEKPDFLNTRAGKVCQKVMSSAAQVMKNRIFTEF